MGTGDVGYIEFQDRFYRFQSARCSYQSGRLYVEAAGDKCQLALPGLPFPDATAITDLPGKVYQSAAEHVVSTGTSEGHVKAGASMLSLRRLTVKCKAVDVAKSVLVLSLQARVEDCVNGGTGEIDGGVRCEIKESGV